MKTFKIREKFIYAGWTYVNAESPEEATKKIENGEGSFDEDTAEADHKDTEWDTLQEVSKP